MEHQDPPNNKSIEKFRDSLILFKLYSEKYIQVVEENVVVCIYSDRKSISERLGIPLEDIRRVTSSLASGLRRVGFSFSREIEYDYLYRAIVKSYSNGVELAHDHSNSLPANGQLEIDSLTWQKDAKIKSLITRLKIEFTGFDIYINTLRVNNESVRTDSE